MRLRHPRSQVEPGKIRKRSDYAQSYEAPVNVVAGTEVESTSTGGRTVGYQGSFELHYEFLAKGATTAKWFHPTEDRVVKILEGRGQVLVNNVAQTTTRGQDIVLVAGAEHCIQADTLMALMYIQPKDYDAALEVHSAAVAPTVVEMRLTTEGEVPVRRGSKAATQQAVSMNDRNADLARRLRMREASGSASPRPSVAGSINAPQPSYGADVPGEPG